MHVPCTEGCGFRLCFPFVNRGSLNGVLIGSDKYTTEDKVGNKAASFTRFDTK